MTLAVNLDYHVYGTRENATIKTSQSYFITWLPVRLYPALHRKCCREDNILALLVKYYKR